MAYMKEGIKKLTFNEDLALGLEFLSINHHDVQTRENLRVPHRASFYLIIWFETGAPVHTVDFQPITIQADSFLFIRKDAVQFFDQRHDFESSILLFTDTFFCNSDNDHASLQNNSLFNYWNTNNLPEPITATNEMRELWRCMQTEEQRPVDPFRAALLKCHLSALMLLAEREMLRQEKYLPAQGVYYDYLSGFMRNLEQSFKAEKSVSYYAEKLFISAKVLTHATQVTMGKTPKQLIEERVLLEARRLLVHSHDTAKTIGFYLGFDEPTNFNKFFRKHSGQTPAEFRAIYRQQSS
jgi:AraC family transcriptional activator of pobA